MAGGVQVGPSDGGRGVFALEAFRRGQRILKFGGAPYDRAYVETAAAAGLRDVYLQVARDRFLGPSGGPDDLVNHSCHPNTYVSFDSDGVYLVACAAIAMGEELFFDYGLTQIRFPFRFDCLCGTDRCRGSIGDCHELPAAVLAEYRNAGMVPRHIEDELRGLGDQMRTAAG